MQECLVFLTNKVVPLNSSLLDLLPVEEVGMSCDRSQPSHIDSCNWGQPNLFTAGHGHKCSLVHVPRRASCFQIYLAVLNQCLAEFMYIGSNAEVVTMGAGNRCCME